MSGGPHESILDGALVHLCLYLAEGECHTDLYPEGAGPNTVEALAEAAGEAAYSAVIHFYKELADGHSRSTSVQ
jgi:hypothetical protein